MRRHRIHIGSAVAVALILAGATTVAFAHSDHGVESDKQPEVPGDVGVTPIEDPAPTLEELRHATQDAIAEADSGVIVCADPQGALAVVVHVGLEDPNVEIPRDIKNQTCDEVARGSHAAN